MIYGLLAQLVLIIHITYIVFALFGGLWGFRWKKAWLVHLPGLIWGLLVEFLNLDCPLTTLENYFRSAAGETGYGRGFLDHFLTALIYPGFPPSIHLVLGATLAAVNVAVYYSLIRKGRISLLNQSYEA